MEMKISKLNLDHPNVLKFLGGNMGEFKKSGRGCGTYAYYTISEFMPNGELYEYVERCGGLSEPIVR
jgi:hypothetical protein